MDGKDASMECLPAIWCECMIAFVGVCLSLPIASTGDRMQLQELDRSLSMTRQKLDRTGMSYGGGCLHTDPTRPQNQARSYSVALG
jgi:hypothetical protein